MDAMKFPLQFDANGLVRDVDGTDDYYKQLLSICTLTEPQSLPLTPDFGIWDPTFNGVEKGAFVLHASRFVPEVEIESVESAINDEGENIVNFSFRRR